MDTLKFILFLYVQNVPHISLKMPMMSGDEYPSYVCVCMFCMLVCQYIHMCMCVCWMYICLS